MRVHPEWAETVRAELADSCTEVQARASGQARVNQAGRDLHLHEESRWSPLPVESACSRLPELNSRAVRQAEDSAPVELGNHRAAGTASWRG